MSYKNTNNHAYSYNRGEKSRKVENLRFSEDELKIINNATFEHNPNPVENQSKQRRMRKRDNISDNGNIPSKMYRKDFNKVNYYQIENSQKNQLCNSPVDTDVMELKISNPTFQRINQKSYNPKNNFKKQNYSQNFHQSYEHTYKTDCPNFHSPNLEKEQKYMKSPILVLPRQSSYDEESSCLNSDSEIASLNEHYKQIQMILNAENANLRHHNQYLFEIIKKLQKNDKKLKNIIKKQQIQIHKLQKERQFFSDRSEELEEFIKRFESSFAQNVQIIKQQPYHSFQPSEQQKNFNQYIQLKNVQETKSTKPTEEEILDLDKARGERIQSLNNKFQQIISKYRNDHDHQARRQCIKIAKQIKTLKSKGKNDFLKNIPETCRESDKSKEKVFSKINLHSQSTKKLIY